MNSRLPIKNKQSGFTLLESLLALFVLTIGILGVAGMQMQGMRAGTVAMQRMQAVSFAEELLERIRANPAGVADYAGGASQYDCTSGTVCTAAEMAADDLDVWEKSVLSVMPGASSTSITVASIDDPLIDPDDLGRIINIDITWVDRGDSYTLSTTTLVNIVINSGG